MMKKIIFIVICICILVGCEKSPENENHFIYNGEKYEITDATMVRIEKAGYIQIILTNGIEIIPDEDNYYAPELNGEGTIIYIDLLAKGFTDEGLVSGVFTPEDAEDTTEESLWLMAASIHQGKYDKKKTIIENQIKSIVESNNRDIIFEGEVSFSYDKNFLTFGNANVKYNIDFDIFLKTEEEHNFSGTYFGKMQYILLPLPK